MEDKRPYTRTKPESTNWEENQHLQLERLRPKQLAPELHVKLLTTHPNLHTKNKLAVCTTQLCHNIVGNIQ